MRLAVALAALLAAAFRLAMAVHDASAGDPASLTGFGFTVVFPLVLIAALLAMGPARSREGVLIRLATAGQLVLIVAVAPYALHLLLGLPIVFLLVELFETRLPSAWREPIAARMIAC